MRTPSPARSLGCGTTTSFLTRTAVILVSTPLLSPSETWRNFAPRLLYERRPIRAIAKQRRERHLEHILALREHDSGVDLVAARSDQIERAYET